jgi:hypothetical protein
MRPATPFPRNHSHRERAWRPLATTIPDQKHHKPPTPTPLQRAVWTKSLSLPAKGPGGYHQSPPMAEARSSMKTFTALATQATPIGVVRGVSVLMRIWPTRIQGPRSSRWAKHRITHSSNFQNRLGGSCLCILTFFCMPPRRGLVVLDRKRAGSLTQAIFAR